MCDSDCAVRYAKNVMLTHVAIVSTLKKIILKKKLLKQFNLNDDLALFGFHVKEITARRKIGFMDLILCVFAYYAYTKALYKIVYSKYVLIY